MLMMPLQLGCLHLPNRVVMAPMTRSRAHAGLPGAETARYYAQRASAGLVISEGTHICEGTAHSPTTAGIYTETQVQAWARVTGAVHAARGRMFLQLWHLGRAWHGGRYPAVGPSAIAARAQRPDGTGALLALPVPVALDEAGIRAVVRQYGQAAVNAMAAGFDGVEIHAANGFLLDQFLRDGSNRRCDRYGGSPEARARLLLEVTERVSAVAGADRVGVRLSPTKTFNDMHDSTPFQTFGFAVSQLARLGLAYLHLAGEAAGSSGIDPATEGLTEHLRERWHGVLILNGGFDGERAERAVAEGRADLVSFATAYIANPDLVRRLRNGEPLNPVNRDRIYGGGADGYTDYPALPDAGTPAAT